MGRHDTTTMRFECDAKCGEVKEIEKARTGNLDLNHANVPQGWEVLRKDASGYMTTNDYKPGAIMLCPKCYRLWEILLMGEATPMGARFREFTKAFWANEQAINTLSETAGKHVEFRDVERDPLPHESTFKAKNYGDLGDGIDND